MQAIPRQAHADSKPFERSFQLLLQAAFATLCVGYAVLAFDYFISFAAGRPGLWNQLLAALVSRDYAYGPGSVHVDQQWAYGNSLRFMLMHTTMGAIGMALGPFQFIGAVRRRYPQAHRTMGKIYLISIGMSMLASLAYLAVTPFDKVFSGAPFAIGLVGLDLMVLWTGWLAYAAIRQRDIPRHQAWMAFNFGLVFVTPLLRMLWVGFGWTTPELTQAQANLGIMTILLPLSLTAAFIWTSLQRPRAGARQIQAFSSTPNS